MAQRLLNSMDEDVASVARELLIEKYQITVKNYEQSLTAAATRLVQFVPKSLMAYQCRRIELQTKARTKELETASPEEIMSLLEEITSLNKMRTMLNNELGRV
jgi:predicted component of type VI protein secretion system